SCLCIASKSGGGGFSFGSRSVPCGGVGGGLAHRAERGFDCAFARRVAKGILERGTFGVRRRGRFTRIHDLTRDVVGHELGERLAPACHQRLPLVGKKGRAVLPGESRRGGI